MRGSPAIRCCGARGIGTATESWDHRLVHPSRSKAPAASLLAQNDMKVFAEASLGNTVDNSKRAGFIKYDRNVLRFKAVWDDRASLYGDIQRFEVSRTSRGAVISRVMAYRCPVLGPSPHSPHSAPHSLFLGHLSRARNSQFSSECTWGCWAFKLGKF